MEGNKLNNDTRRQTASTRQSSRDVKSNIAVSCVQDSKAYGLNKASRVLTVDKSVTAATVRQTTNKPSKIATAVSSSKLVSSHSGSNVSSLRTVEAMSSRHAAATSSRKSTDVQRSTGRSVSQSSSRSSATAVAVCRESSSVQSSLKYQSSTPGVQPSASASNADVKLVKSRSDRVEKQKQAAMAAERVVRSEAPTLSARTSSLTGQSTSVSRTKDQSSSARLTSPPPNVTHQSTSVQPGLSGRQKIVTSPPPGGILSPGSRQRTITSPPPGSVLPSGSRQRTVMSPPPGSILPTGSRQRTVTSPPPRAILPAGSRQQTVTNTSPPSHIDIKHQISDTSAHRGKQSVSSASMSGKTLKVSSDTQTAASAIQSMYMKHNLSTEHPAESRQKSAVNESKTRLPSDDKTTVLVKDQSSSSLNSDSAASEEAAKSSSNSNNSVESIVYKPSGCKESDSETTVVSSKPATDHISSLRLKKHEDKTSCNDKTVASKDESSGFDTDIKPMEPLARSSPYAYLRGLPVGAAATVSSRSRDALSAANRLGVHRPLIDQRCLHASRTAVIREVQDGGCGPAENVDFTAGYMSDGDIMRTTSHMSSSRDDANCGYMSEGGVSLYMKRMQQRFREGMLAVRECMEKSNGLTDDDSMDDTSSISSGDISDAVAEMSTDDNITTGSSLSANSSDRLLGSPYTCPAWSTSAPYSSLPVSHRSGVVRMGGPGYSASASQRMYRIDSGGSPASAAAAAENWQKYTIMPCKESSSMRRGDRGCSTLPLTAGHVTLQTSLMTNAAGVRVKRSNQAVVTDLKCRSLRSGTAIAIDGNSPNCSDEPAGSKQKRDSETNTENSALMMLAHRNRSQYVENRLAQTESFDHNIASARKPSECQRTPSLESSRSQTIDRCYQRSASTVAPSSHWSAKSDHQQWLSEANNLEDLEYKAIYNNSRSPLQQQQQQQQQQHQQQHDMSSAKCKSEHQQYSPATTMSHISASGAHGSTLSLISSSSSVYSTAEEKQSQEIRKLHRELEAALDKVNTLTTQLNTNAHVVAAFEQSLSNMTQRLQQLTITSQQKDLELSELRQTIEAFRQSAGLVSTANQSAHHLQFSTQTDAAQMNRHMSVDSVSSLKSFSSALSGASQQSTATDVDKKKKRKNWLKNSFSRTFLRKKAKNGSVSDMEYDASSISSDQPTTRNNSQTLSMPSTPINGPTTISPLMSRSDHLDGAMVFQLKQQLHEKDLRLTDIQLEALSSAHQLEQLVETMNRMKSEMASLKSDNDRLQKLIVEKVTDQDEARRLLQPNITDSISSPTSPVSSITNERLQVLLSIKMSPLSDTSLPNENKLCDVDIGLLNINTSTKWDAVDIAVRRAFKEYVKRLDPATSLGLTTESILSYSIGTMTRIRQSKPCDTSLFCCLQREKCNRIYIHLKGSDENCADQLAFETLIPKSIVQRYVSLLLEHRRIILCGPNGTGKTFLTQKLANYVVNLSKKQQKTGAIATFNVDHKSGKELGQYLANIAEQCERSASELPNIIILDNLHHVGSLADVFSGFLNSKHQHSPYIIGTMNQSNSASVTNLQLHHNFRWVLCANHTEPVHGFLSRYLKRRLITSELRSGIRNEELQRIMDWLPSVWKHINKFLESCSSTDVTIGPRLFLSCPMDAAEARVWFTDLWNYSVVPYILEAVRDAIQTNGHKAALEDPTDWVNSSCPWSTKLDSFALFHLRMDDINTTNTNSIKQTDPSVSASSNLLAEK